MADDNHPAGFVEDARVILGAEGVVADPGAAEEYLADWRGRWTGHSPLIARPRDVGQVADLVRLCARHGVPIAPQGGNTGVVHGSIPHGEVLLSLRRMNRVLEVDPIGDTVTVEAGAVLADVQRAADAADRLFPLSLGAEGTATIGGTVSTNAGGIAVLRYGMMRDLVLGLEVVLADGTVWDGRRALRKDNTGYDVKQAFIGAEGTLGVVTGAVLKLFPRPRARETAWVATSSVSDAVALYARMRACSGEAMTGFELVPRGLVDLVLRHIPGTRDPLPARAAFAVLIEMSFFADGGRALLEEVVAAGIGEGLAVDAVVASSDVQAQAMWRVRESIAEAERAHKRALKHDISLPIARLPDFVSEAAREIERIAPGAEIFCFGHVGDGNLHYNVGAPEGADDNAFLSRPGSAITSAIYDTVRAMGGSISAEHGIGLLRREALARHLPAAEIALMRRMKAAFDPRNLLNPGRILAD